MADKNSTATLEVKASKDGAPAKPGKQAKARKAAATPVQTVVSAIMPVRNMADSIETMYNDLRAGLQQYGQPFEIIIVDDASTDATWRRLDALAQKDRQLKLIRMRSSFGESSAFDAALKHVEGEKVVYAAARVRANLAQIGKLLRKLDDGNDLVVGWRWPRKDSGLNQRISRWFNLLVQKITKATVNDINSSIFVTRRDVLENITFYGDLNIFIPLLAAQKGYIVTEEQIEQLPGQFRESRYLSEYIQRLLDIISVVFLTKYSKKPLHFLGFFGMIFTLVGVLMNLYLFIYRIFGFGPIAGRPLLLFSVLLLVIGLQMISIGLIGEMIIYTHARDIQEYNIETVINA